MGLGFRGWRRGRGRGRVRVRLRVWHGLRVSPACAGCGRSARSDDRCAGTSAVLWSAWLGEGEGEGSPTVSLTLTLTLALTLTLSLSLNLTLSQTLTWEAIAHPNLGLTLTA